MDGVLAPGRRRAGPGGRGYDPDPDAEWFLIAGDESAVPAGESRVWVAAEAGVIRRVRSDLLGRGGLDPRQVVTRGYWKAGAANHPDHDYGDDT